MYFQQGKLDGYLKNPPASEFIHSIFTSVGFVSICSSKLHIKSTFYFLSFVLLS